MVFQKLGMPPKHHQLRPIKWAELGPNKPWTDLQHCFGLTRNLCHKLQSDSVLTLWLGKPGNLTNSYSFQLTSYKSHFQFAYPNPVERVLVFCLNGPMKSIEVKQLAGKLFASWKHAMSSRHHQQQVPSSEWSELASSLSDSEKSWIVALLLLSYPHHRQQKKATT